MSPMKRHSIIHEHGKLFVFHIKILNVPRVHLRFLMFQSTDFAHVQDAVVLFHSVISIVAV